MINILVIEDSKTINNIIYKELTKQKFQVTQAFRLSEAKKYLEQVQYSLIILDLHLPDGEGSELIAEIQSLSDTKVVVLTSNTDSNLREELFQYGILDYIIKDTNLLYSIAEIVKVIDSIQNKIDESILIIDDSQFICKQVKTILEPRNYKVTYSLNAINGIEELHKKNFNLLILDMELPDIHGLKVLAILRKNIRFKTLPILILSGTTTPEIIRNVLKNGANDILTKPFVFEEFILKVDLWINYFKKERLLQEKNLELKYLNDNLKKFISQEVEKNQKQQHLLLQQSRLAQMGEMISMIAHQWRQPLNNLALVNQLLVSKYKKGKLNENSIDYFQKNSKKQITQMSETIDDFRNFFKPTNEKVSFSVNSVIKNTLSMIQDIYSKDDITIEYKSSKDFYTQGYPNELGQALLNIINNSKDALIDKNIKNKYIKIDTISFEKNNFLVRVEDNAGGINQTIASKIFNPYFSTKESKNGTGLGLYMAKIIVHERLNGSLTFSNTQEGVMFKITLYKDKNAS